MKKISLSLLALCFAGAIVQVNAVLPEGSGVTPEDAVVEENGVLVAQRKAKLVIPVPPNTSAIYLEGKVGKAKGITVNLAWEGTDDETRFALRAEGGSPHEDQFISMRKGRRFYVRPNIQFYGTRARIERMQSRWKDFPAASEFPLKMEIKSWPEMAEIWMNDRLVDNFPDRGFLREIRLELDEGASIQGISFGTREETGRYLPVKVSSFARLENWEDIMGDMAVPDLMKNAQLSLPPGRTTIKGIPVDVAPAGKSVNLSHMGYINCRVDDLVTYYWRRSSVEAMPECFIVSVPMDTYSAAYVLCAATVDDDKKIPEFTVRLTRNSSGRGDSIADTRVKLPADGKDTEDATKVGEVTYNGKKVPLWLVRVPLKVGRLQDVLREDETKYGYGSPLPTDRYLDIELLEPVDGSEEEEPFPTDPEAPTRRKYMPSGLRTSVHVFGLTLEKSPAELVVRSNVPGYAFYEAENPTLLANVNVREKGDYRLEWKIADVDGKIVDKGEKLIHADSPKEETVQIPLKTGKGWFATQIVLGDAKGGKLIDHRSTYAILAPDTRQAGQESPFGTWWFNWAHGGTADYENVGRLFLRAGIRHTQLKADNLMTNYKVTPAFIPWRQPRAENWVGDLEDHIRKSLEVVPSAPTIMIHHESDSYGGRFPSELWGQEPPPLSERNETAWANRMKFLVPGLQMIREKFPHLKIQLGNSGNSCALVAEMFRRGLPKDVFDYVAIEDLGQTIMPELPVLGAVHSAWFLRETARKFGYTDAKVTACYEWISRMHMKIGLKRQAEYYIRDMLIALAYGFHHIAPGAIHDAGQGYFHTIWGNGGLCFRYPYMYPKPAYVAVATLTQVVDSAKFTRLAPTGSQSLYALEFEKPGEWTYAIWTPRGTRETKLTFPSETEISVIDMYGREKTTKAKEIDVTASTGALYVKAKAQVEQIAAGKATFPEDPAPAGKVAVLDPMEDDGNWEFKGGELRMQGTNFPHRRPGNFQRRIVNDEEKGKCLELELVPDQELPWPVVQEQVWLSAPFAPVVSGGPYEHVGLWVKGNSSFGEINIEVKNVLGETKLLTGSYKGEQYINFDGWNFVRFKLPEGEEWRNDVSVTGVRVYTSRNVLYGTEFVPTQNLKLRLKDLCLF